MNTRTDKPILLQLCKVIIILSTFYSIHLANVPSILNVRYVGMTVLLILYIFYYRKCRISIGFKSNVELSWFWETLFVVIYTYFITWVRQASGQTYTDKVFNFFLMATVLSYMMTEVFDDTEDFCTCFIIASTIQAVIVLLTIIYSPFRTTVISLQDMNYFKDFNHKYNYRVIGLGIAGSGGSIYLVCGLIANAYKILYKKLTRFNTITYIIIFSAVAMVARTGFYVATIITLYVLFSQSKNSSGKSKFFIYLGIVIAIISMLYVVMVSFGYLQSIDFRIFNYTIGRLDALFDERNALDRVSETYTDTPGISLYTLFGSGIYRGTASNGLHFYNDSGYAKRYAAIGLIMTVFSYLSLFVYLVRKMKYSQKYSKIFFMLLIVIMFIIEYKEHFIYQYSLPTTIIMLLSLENKEILPKEEKF